MSVDISIILIIGMLANKDVFSRDQGTMSYAHVVLITPSFLALRDVLAVVLGYCDIICNGLFLFVTNP